MASGAAAGMRPPGTTPRHAVLKTAVPEIGVSKTADDSRIVDRKTGTSGTSSAARRQRNSGCVMSGDSARRGAGFPAPVRSALGVIPEPAGGRLIAPRTGILTRAEASPALMHQPCANPTTIRGAAVRDTLNSGSTSIRAFPSSSRNACCEEIQASKRCHRATRSA